MSSVLAAAFESEEIINLTAAIPHLIGTPSYSSTLSSRGRPLWKLSCVRSVRLCKLLFRPQAPEPSPPPLPAPCTVFVVFCCLLSSAYVVCNFA